MERTVRRAFTLTELIFVLVIVAVLSVAAFKALSLLGVRSFKAKELTRLTLQSQVAIDQISLLLSQRIPASAIGYDMKSGDFDYIGYIANFDKYKIFEWLNRPKEEFDKGKYSSFADMVPSINDTGYRLKTPMLDMSGDGYNLIFAGSFDIAYSDTGDIKDAFGWHSHQSRNSFDISFDSANDIIKITDPVKPKRIYEKYFLTNGSFAIARGVDIEKNAECIKDLELKDIDNTLFLFYGYRPWKGESFCADAKSQKKSGKATVLMEYVSGFAIREQDHTIRVIMDINRSVKGSSPIHFSKMKVVF